MAFGEFTFFVVEILCGVDMMKQSVVVLSPNLATREYDGMEGDVILAHELVQVYVVGVLPPLLPV